MSNKLKDLFTEETDELTGTIYFDNKQYFEEFEKKISQLDIDGKPQKITGIQSVRLNVSDGGSQYLFEKEKSIKEMMVYPYLEEVKIPLVLDGKPMQVIFLKQRTKDCIKLSTPEGSIIEISLNLYIQEKQVKFSYQVHEERAQNIQELIGEYTQLVGIINVFFATTQINYERDKMKSNILDVISYLQRLEELSSVLGIYINPALINAEDNKDWMIEKLYLLFVKKSVIRSDDRLNFITQVEVTKCEVGQELFAGYINEQVFELFNEKIRVYTVNCIFNAIVSKIENDDDGTSKLYFTDSDSKPMYRSYSGCMTLDEAEKEREDVFNHIERYKEAKKFMEQLKFLVSEKEITP